MRHRRSRRSCRWESEPPESGAGPYQNYTLQGKNRDAKLALVSLTLTILTFGGVAGSSDLVPAIAYDYTKLYEKVSPSVFKIEVDSGHGSGFLVDSRGLIATNHHVIRNTRYLAVKVSESLTVPAEIIVSSSRYDLGIVKVHEKFVEGIDPLPVLSHDREDTLKGRCTCCRLWIALVNKT